MRATTPDSYMRRAIALSRRGLPQPNPHVGCVIVQRGRIVGEGWHEYQGGPHAEIVALRMAGTLAEGATAYVTLEPCNHAGRTGPCSVALREARIARVVYACPDPNPKASGGAEALRQAGVETIGGVLESEAREANLRFLRSFELVRPYVVAKAAVTLDGRIALPSGDSQWITGPAARRAGHRLRAEYGAVLVGRGTVEKDDPLLTARIRGVRHQPLRVVLDPGHKLTGNEKVFNGDAETLWLDAAGPVSFVNGKADLHALLAHLWSRGINGLLVEGGGKTLSSFIAGGLVDRLELFVGTRIFGTGPAWVEGISVDSIESAPEFELSRVQRLGQDVHLSYTRR